MAPVLGNPGGAYVRGSALQEEAALNVDFLENLPKTLPETARAALQEREQRRADQSISLEEAVAAGWSAQEVGQMNEAAWDACRIAMHLDTVRQRGLEFFYHVGTNDNVCPALLRLGEQHPDFPLYILPGGQHGGPKTSGFTLQTPTQPEAEENLLALALHHFFDARALPATPKLEIHAHRETIKITVALAAGITPQRNTLSWGVNRHPPYTYAAEYDQWNSVPLAVDAGGRWNAEIPVPPDAKTIDFVSTHTQVENDIPFHFSSPYRRWTP